MNNLIGQSIGRYHIVEQLGAGGMAYVYKAYDTRLERDVAMKVIRTGVFGSDVLDEMLKRFEREAKTLAKLTHPNIVSIIDYGEYEGAPYLVMPYLPGRSLKERLGKAIPYQEAAKILAPIADALAYAHSLGIVHRDVKPANILITASGQPMLTDFGIAKILESDGQTLTGSGVGIGTPEYMAPEQWTGQVTRAVDIYSMGVVFYELITGHKPYTADTPAAVLLKQATEPLLRPASFVANLPEIVEQIIFKSLSKKPEDRFQTMQEFGEALLGLSTGITEDQKPTHKIEPSTRESLIADTSATVVEPSLQGNQIESQAVKRGLPLKAKGKTSLPTRNLSWKIGLVGIGLIFILVIVTIISNSFPFSGQLPTQSYITKTMLANTTVDNRTATFSQLAEITKTPTFPITASPEYTETAEGLPDLIPIESYEYKGWHLTDQDGWYTDACAKVQNNGTKASGDFKVQMQTAGMGTVTLSFDSIAPGQTGYLCSQIKFSLSQVGKFCQPVTIIVDPANLVAESNESNNRYVGQLCFSY